MDAFWEERVAVDAVADFDGEAENGLAACDPEILARGRLGVFGVRDLHVLVLGIVHDVGVLVGALGRCTWSVLNRGASAALGLVV